MLLYMSGIAVGSGKYYLLVVQIDGHSQEGGCSTWGPCGCGAVRLAKHVLPAVGGSQLLFVTRRAGECTGSHD